MILSRKLYYKSIIIEQTINNNGESIYKFNKQFNNGYIKSSRVVNVLQYHYYLS